MKKLIYLSALCAAIVFSSCSKRSDKIEEKESSKKEVSQSFIDLRLAADLSKYGYANNAPLALIQAAQIVSKYQSKELKLVASKNIEGPKNNLSDKKGKVEIETEKLIADAKAMASDNPNLLNLIGSLTESSRGAVYGLARIYCSVKANDWGSCLVAFVAGELAEVAAIGDGDTDLDLYIYDSNGNLIAKDDDYTDRCYVSWVPRWTGNYIVKVVNRGGVYNNFILATN